MLENPPPHTGLDWNQYGPTIVWGVVIAVIGALVRGQWTNLVMRAMESAEGKVRTKSVVDALYADRIRQNDELLAHAIDAARENGSKADSIDEKVEAVAQIQQLQGSTLRDVERATNKIPEFTRALEAVAESNDRLSDTMQTMAIAFARMEEREKERERRWHDIFPNPGTRLQDRP